MRGRIGGAALGAGIFRQRWNQITDRSKWKIVVRGKKSRRGKNA
jgi:hypothetical protein